MRYLVMETHPAYSVLLDEEGRYLKAANQNHQVGETVEEIVPLRVPKSKSPSFTRPLAGLAAMAACICLIFFGYYVPNHTYYGTLRIQINPDVEMTISRTERVLALAGLNQDGRDLIQGYPYQGKDRDTATEELVDRAIEMGYLSGGATISITVTSSDADWRAREEAQVRQQLEERYGDSVVIELGPPKEGSGKPAPTPLPDPDVEVVIPVAPPTPPPTTAPSTPDIRPVPPSQRPSSSGGGKDAPYPDDDGDDDDDGAGHEDDDPGQADSDYGPDADDPPDTDDQDDDAADQDDITDGADRSDDGTNGDTDDGDDADDGDSGDDTDDADDETDADDVDDG